MSARRLRAITLPPAEGWDDPQAEWCREERDAEGYIRRRRVGGRLYTESHRISESKTSRGTVVHRTTVLTEEPAYVEFEAILDAAEVLPDSDNCDLPWEIWDGWEHTLVPLVSAEARCCRGTIWHHGCAHRVVMDPQLFEDNFRHLRESGASRQAAFEVAAARRREMTAQVAAWRRDGVQWWCVECYYLGVEDSCHGIDDEDCADKHIRQEVAEQVASQLEERGYLIRGRPDREKPRWRGWTAAAWEEHLKRQHHMQDWPLPLPQGKPNKAADAGPSSQRRLQRDARRRIRKRLQEIQADGRGCGR